MAFTVKVADGVSQLNDQDFKLIKGKDVDLTETTELTTGNLTNADSILIDEAHAGTQTSTKHALLSSLWTYILGKINGTTLSADTSGNAATVTTNANLTGDVTSSGNATTIAADAVTYAKMQNVSADERILGRVSGADGVIEELTKAQMLTMMNVADGANAYVHPNHSGEVTSTADGATVIADDVVDEANLKVSNTPTDGYFLSAQSGDTGGLTWAAASGGATDLTATANGTSLTVNSSTGDNVSLPAADTDNWGVMTDEMFDAIAANTAKATNVSTDLSVTANGTSLTVNSSDGTNATLPAADTDNWGVMTDEMFDAIAANTAKNTNVTTDLGISTSTTTATVTSSDGTNAIIPVATTSVGGVMSKAIFDEHTANNAKNTNVVGDLSATASGLGLTIETTNGDNVSVPAATSTTWGAMTDEQASSITTTAALSAANNTLALAALPKTGGTMTGALTVNELITPVKGHVYAKTSTTHFEAQGDIVKFGTGSTTQGALVFYKGDGSWNNADANLVATCGATLLGIALGNDPDEDGVLLRGMVTLDHDPGTLSNALYVSTTAGDITGTAPSGSGDVVRVVGYCIDSDDGQIWFNPDGAWVEIV